jgi:predicted tellurium resistance membrane protein TerC
MGFRFNSRSNWTPIGCGSALVLFGVILLTPVGVWLVKAVGWLSVVAGLTLLATGIYFWAIRFRRRYYR